MNFEFYAYLFVFLLIASPVIAWYFLCWLLDDWN